MKTILLLGKNGQIGWELQRSLAPLGELIAFGRQEVDFEKSEKLRQLVRRIRPDTIVNAAAYTAVDKAESEPEKARLVNADAVGILAEEAERLNAWLVHYSTDYVFDGMRSSPYVELDSTNPLSVYGRTKLEGERLIQKLHVRHLIFRTSWVYAARGNNFVKTIVRLAKERDKLTVVADQHGSPTSAELIADITALALYRIGSVTGAASTIPGIYHIAAGGETTWYNYAQYVLALARGKGLVLKAGVSAVQPVSTGAFPSIAARPKNSLLNTTKLTGAFNIRLPDWRYHVQRLMEELLTQGSI